MTEPLWSVDLGLHAADSVQPDPRGVLVSTKDELIALGADGHTRWRVACGPTTAAPLPRPDGRIISAENAHLVLRDGQSGRAEGALPAARAFMLTPDAWGGVLVSQPNLAGGVLMSRLDPSGALRSWAVLPGPPRLDALPVPLTNAVVVLHDGQVTVLDPHGAVWAAATRAGFVRGRPDTGDAVWASPRAAGPMAVVFGLRGPHASPGLFRADVAAGTVEAFAPWLVPGLPVEVIPDHDGGFAVAANGPRYEVGHLAYEHTIVLIGADGQTRWEHRLAPEPAAVAAATTGLIISATPTEERWQQYSRWQDLSPQTLVRSVGPDGSTRWTWHPPGAITNHPRVGPDGTVYVGATGRLWALRP
jgi:hypothetical protein